MKFRPCIDIHNGKVKQIVGGSLTDKGDRAKENFVAEKDAAFFADFYRNKGLTGGHIILLNPSASPCYEATRHQALLALKAFPGAFQLGGGITPENAENFLNAGASHVIVTSYIFQNGTLRYDRLDKMRRAVGKERLVLDLSCRKRENDYYIVTDRWQNYTDVKLNSFILDQLSSSCDEFLIHGVDVEGKAQGIEEELVKTLGNNKRIPVTYAGGVHDFQDLRILKELGKGRVDVTIGSALDLFGGGMKLDEVLAYMEE